MTSIFLCLLSIKRKFLWYICDSVPAKKDLEHTIWQPFEGNCKFWGQPPRPPKKMRGINSDCVVLADREVIGVGCVDQETTPSVRWRSWRRRASRRRAVRRCRGQSSGTPLLSDNTSVLPPRTTDSRPLSTLPVSHNRPPPPALSGIAYQP